MTDCFENPKMEFEDIKQPWPIVVFVTSPNRTTSDLIAKTCLEAGLCACVNILPGITSYYLWKDNLHCDEEEMLIIKTSEQRLKTLESHIRELHPYEVPEFLAIQSSYASDDYMKWVLDILRS